MLRISLLTLVVVMNGCTITLPKVKVEGPDIDLPGVKIEIENDDKEERHPHHCPPGQARKRHC